LSGFRVFGTDVGAKPEKVNNVAVARSDKDPNDGRVAEVSWSPAAGADFYVIRYGIAPDKLNSSYQVYNKTSKEIRSLISGVHYYFTVDAVNAAGINAGKKIVDLQP
jgi:hypothetical protein